MRKVRIISHSDGGIAIIHPAPKSRRENEGEEEWLRRVFDKATPDGASYEDIDESEIPATREDRDAWELKDGKIEVNQAKKQQFDEDKQNKKNTKASAVSKLKVLGLTQEEVSNIIKEEL